MARESMDFDVVIVGAGPAGLATGIRLAQLARQHQTELNICIIDKGEQVGSHIISGAVLEPRSLNELFPDWRNMNPPMHTAVIQDQFLFLTKNKSWRLPTPPQMRNHGNYIISLEQFTRWLAEQAELLGVNVFPGFAATEAIFQDNRVTGVITGDKGIAKNGEHKPNFQEGMELRARQVVLAEGCRGSLTKSLSARYGLLNNCDPQTYGLGIKEIWEIPPEIHQAGHVMHSIGWPLDQATYGGSFMYHFGDKYLAIGFVIGLDYQNPYLNPYEEFQCFKTHPTIRPLLEQGQRTAYGARTLIEGGLQSIPTLTFPGGLIVGDAAGFVNVPKIKGIHNAIKSGMVAAESLYATLADHQDECHSYRTNLESSWLWDDLARVRNIRPAMRWGLLPGLAYSALDTYLLRGRAPWTLHHHITDNAALKKAYQCKKIDYPKHDNKITFDLPTSVYLTHTHHDENEPCHLLISNKETPVKINLDEYAGPEQRYCPAGVYEFPLNEKQQPYLQINAANCIHCKACDIKDPTQNITWTPPEGGDGPQYEMM